MLIDLTPPSAEPITLEEAKTFLRADHDDEDTLINTLIYSARERLESHLRLAMIQRPMRTSGPARDCVELPRWPVASVDAVSVDGAETDDYTANLKSRPVNVRVYAREEIEIDFTAGYGPEASDVPTPLRQAMLLLVARSYEDRLGSDAPMPLMVDALTAPYRGIGL